MSKRCQRAFRTSNLLLYGTFATAIIFLLHITNISHILDPFNREGMRTEQTSKNIQTLQLRANTILDQIAQDKEKLEGILDSRNIPKPIDVQHVKYETIAQSFEKESMLVKGIEHMETELLIPPPKQITGGDKHRILSLSDEEFKRIPLSEMMSWYGEAEGGGSCSEDFGNKLIDRWRSTKQTVCQNPLAQRAKLSASRALIDCYLVRQTRHHGNGDNLCVMKNVSVGMGLFGDDSRTTPVIERYVGTKHMDQPYVDFPRGFIKSPCTPAPDQWQERFMPGWNAQWTTGALEQCSDSAINLHSSDDSIGLRASEKLCDEWVEHPVLIVQRDTFANFFHDSEDFFNAFIAMAVLQWDLGSTQVYLTDLYPKGPFWDIWGKAFSAGGQQTLDAWDLRSKFGQRGIGANKKGAGHRVCFRELAVGIYGPAAPMTVNSWDTPCHTTALVRAYSDFIIRGFNLQGLTHYAQDKPSQTIVITYLARRASSEWPEKRFCDDQNSFFKCRYWASWGIRSLGRMVRNDGDVVAGLRQLESHTFRSGAKVKFQDVDFNLLSLEEQIKVDLDTDILVGPHGAGLMHNIFMRDRAVLMELSVDGSGGLRHFHNLARWFGRKYVGVSPGNPIDVNDLRQNLIDVVEGISLDEY